uniref:Uncharacterized protein n=1 Tax=Siphoviridae sp. ct0106 TaxID=2825290 RepID=A0A8S5P6S0_9CAUD|nr:MAG TPA: hypothetical protein [Siphoviridae sp. ct0106]
MSDETFTALQYAGPASWHHLIAPTRTFPLTEFSIHSIAYAMSPGDRELSGNEPVVRLGALAAAANLTSNAIANITFTADANTIFDDARMTASILDITNKKLPQFTPNVSTYKYVARALRTNAPQVLSMLLIDIIRTANHIIGN